MSTPSTKVSTCTYANVTVALCCQVCIYNVPIIHQPTALCPWNSRDQVIAGLDDNIDHLDPQRLKFAMVPQRRGGVDLSSKLTSDAFPPDAKLHVMIAGKG